MSENTERDPNEPVAATYGHGSIKLTAYPSSGRIRVEASADNSVMDWSELFEFVDRIRKPLTITTVEELDALPEGTTIVDQAERLTLEETSIQCLEWVDRHGNSCHVELPATILDEASL